VSKAWRFWSLDDPSLHQAMYQFDDEARLAAMLKGDALKQLVADFNRDWPAVTRHGARRWCWHRRLRSSSLSPLQ